LQKLIGVDILTELMTKNEEFTGGLILSMKMVTLQNLAEKKRIGGKRLLGTLFRYPDM